MKSNFFWILARNGRQPEMIFIFSAAACSENNASIERDYPSPSSPLNTFLNPQKLAEMILEYEPCFLTVIIDLNLKQIDFEILMELLVV